MTLVAGSPVGLVLVEDAIVVGCKANGFDVHHLSSHSRTSKAGPARIKSNTMRYGYLDKQFSVNIVLVDVPEGSYATAAIFDTSRGDKMLRDPLYTRGFSVGESLSLSEVVTSVNAKLTSLLKGALCPTNM